MATPVRRSRRLAGEDSGVEFSKVADDDTVTVRDTSSGITTTHSNLSPRKGGKKKLAEEEQEEARRFYTYAVVCFAAIAVMLYQAPPVPAGGMCDNVSLPWLVKGVASGNLIGTLIQAWQCAEAYNRAHPQYTLGIISSVYIGLQTFAIPGPVVLSIVGGALYGFWGGQLLNAVCAGIGASACFMLSKTMGRGVLRRFKLSDQLEGFAATVAHHRDDLFTYMLLTRVTPVPNVLINVASPMVGVPLWIFALSTPIGQFPLNALHVTTGATLAAAAGNPDAIQDKLKENKTLAYGILGLGSILGAAFVFYKRRTAASKED